MKCFKSAMILIVVLTMHSLAQNNENGKYFSDTTNYAKMRDSLVSAYTKEYKAYKEAMDPGENKKGLGSSFFGLNLDVIFGIGFANADLELNRDTSGLSNPNTKTGPMLGVNVNFNLMGFSLATGFNYSSKGFSTNTNSYSANYFNIPLMFVFDFNISKVEINLAAGPYVGILLSQEKTENYALKNIDLGITGSIQGNYFFNRFLGAVIGVKYERGGLNNLLESTGVNNNVTSVKTQNWFIYSGIKFVL